MQNGDEKISSRFLVGTGLNLYIVYEGVSVFIDGTNYLVDLVVPPTAFRRCILENNTGQQIIVYMHFRNNCCE